MADTRRPSSPALELERALAEEPWRYGFFAALRLLECAYAELPRLGTATRPVDEPVRLGQEPTMAFAPSTLASFGRRGEGLPPKLAVFFLGLFGPNGPLPLHLTEHARSRVRNEGDETFVAFADLFHHRALSLFYRAWAQGQPTVNFDRPNEDDFARQVASLIGLGMDSLRGGDTFDDLGKLYLSGHLGQQTRHADGLRSMLAFYFDVPVELIEFMGVWIELPDNAVCRLGEDPATGGLGTSAILGARVWECQQKFRVVVGPLGLEAYRRFLPGEPTLNEMKSVVRNYIGDEMLWDVQVLLRKDEVPGTQLGHQGQLGWTSWLLGKQPEQDVGDMVLYPAE